MKKNVSIKSILTFNFILVATLPLIIIAIWGMYNLSNNMEREITEKNFFLAKTIAGELEVILGHPLLHLKLIRDVTESKKIVTPDDLNDYFTSLVEVKRVFNMIKILDHKGIVTHLAPFNENIIGLDMSNQEYYRSSLDIDDHYWSKTFISSQTGMPTLTLTLPLKQGLLVGHLNLSHLNQITKRMKISEHEHENVVITDKNGVVIVHPKRELISERFNAKHLYHIQQGLAGIEGTFKYNLEDKETIGSVVIVPQTGWLVAISQSVDEAFEPIKKLRNFIYISIIIAILIALLISLTNLRRILQPLIHLTEESKRIAGGDYTYKLSETSFIEIDNLNSSFKTMINAVNTRENALRDEIIERKKVQKSLLKNQYYLTKAQGIGTIGSWELDIQKNILIWTDENYKIFGVPLETEMNLELFIDCVHPDDRDYVIEKWNAGLNNEPYDIEHRLLINDTVKWVREKADIEFNTEGNPIMAIGFTQDITERKQAEEKLKNYHERLEELVKERTNKLEEKTNKLEKSQKSLALLLEDVNESRAELDISNRKLQVSNKDLEAFSYSVSHDLRAPLRHIDGFTKLLNKNIKHKIDEKAQNYFDNIISSSKQMNKLIDDLLIFSRMGRKDVKKTKINMKTVIEEARQIFDHDIKENNISITVDDMPEVNIDAPLMRQVWVNLISNAIKFTGNKEKPEIHIGTDNDTDSNTIFFIKDNGVGFDQKYVDKIFGVFQSLHNINEFPGTGIGLANVKRIITKHGGEIRAEGKVNEGASFFFTLP